VTDSIQHRKEVLFEGFSKGEILDLPDEQIEGLVLTGQPIVFRAGSATVLGEFRRDGHRLVIELAQIDGGGEGVLVSLGSLADRYARLHGILAVEWIVHAVTCAKPNLKLRRVLERRGFSVRNIPGMGEAYYFLDSIAADENVSHADEGAGSDSPAPHRLAAPRTGWDEASGEIRAHSDDAMAFPEFANEGDAELKW
jgi:hypothetical protein